MNLSNPQMTVTPGILDPGGAAQVTLSFEAGPGQAPAEIILMLDRSAEFTEAQLQASKDGVIRMIRDIAAANAATKMGVLSFADTCYLNSHLTTDTDALIACLDKIQPTSQLANYKEAFETASTMLARQEGYRTILVLFSHSSEKASADTDPVVQQLKDSGVEICCIGLATDPARLTAWATGPSYVATTDVEADLPKIARQITAEVVPAGVLDGEIRMDLSPDFLVSGIVSQSAGTAVQEGEAGVLWTVDVAGMVPETLSLVFDIRHTGTGVGMKTLTASYMDRSGNVFEIPAVRVEIATASPAPVDDGTSLVAEPCPAPTELTVESCKDAVRVLLSPTLLGGLGRIVQLDATIKNVCPNRKVAVSVILTEVDADGKESPRGVKHILHPGHTAAECRDILLKCIQFSLPEVLDPSGSVNAICNSRKLYARVIANYVDTDYICCSADPETL